MRDCDGTHLPKNALEIADKVYNTYFVVRGDNAWADNHTDELQSVLLMTGYCLATEETLVIDLLKGYSHDQLGVNEENPKNIGRFLIEQPVKRFLLGNTWVRVRYA